MTLASFVNRYEEHGGGDLHSFSWAWDDAPPYARTGEVDTLDGFLLVLSPWAVRTLRFDESLGRVPRLRPGLLPPGSRGRAQGRDRRLPGDPPPAARDGARPGALDRGARARWRRSGTAACPGSARARAVGASARCAQRPSATRRARSRYTRDAASSRRGCARPSARWPRPRESVSWRITAAVRARLARVAGLIAFGTSIIDPAAYMRYARPGIHAAAEPGARGVRVRRRSAASAAAATCCSTRRPRATTSRRSCWSTSTSRSPSRTCARRCGAPSATPTSPSSAATGAAGVRSDRLVGGAVSRGAVAARYDEHDGGELPAFSWADVDAPPGRGRRRRRPGHGALAVGGAQPAVRRVARSSATATTSTTACRRARRGRKVVTADIGATHHRPLKLVRRA